MNASLFHTRNGGAYTLVGVIKGDLVFPDSEVHRRELTIRASRNATRQDFEHVMASMRAGKIATDRQKKLDDYMDEALEKELTKFDDEVATVLRGAYRAAPDQRTAEQKKLLGEYPSVGNLSPGTLYQYNPAAAEELKKIDATISTTAAKKPFQDFIPVLNEIAGQVPPIPQHLVGDFSCPGAVNQHAAGGAPVDNAAALCVKPQDVAVLRDEHRGLLMDESGHPGMP